MTEIDSMENFLGDTVTIYEDENGRIWWRLNAGKLRPAQSYDILTDKLYRNGFRW